MNETPVKKKLAWFGAFSASIAALVIGVVYAPAKDSADALAKAANEAAANIPDTCPPEMCTGWKPGTLFLTKTDGGPSDRCECP